MNKKDSNFDGFLEILAARELKDSYKRKYEEKPNGEKFKIKKVDEPKSARLINVSFALGKDRGDYNRLSSQLKRGFALNDKKADAQFIKEFENGALFSKIDNTLKNFSEEEILAKTEIITQFTNRNWTYDFIEFIKDTEGIKSSLESLERNLKKIDSNLETLKNSGNAQELEKQKREKRKKEVWKNFNESVLKFSEKYEILEPMKIDKKTKMSYKKLVGVKGHSKGGGEANYVASVLNLKSFTVDPAPCEKYGMYLNNNKFLSIVPNNGRGTLTEAVKVPTTNTYMMRQTAMSQGKILKTEKTPNFSGKYVMNLAERVVAAKISNKKENEKNTKNEQKNDYQR